MKKIFKNFTVFAIYLFCAFSFIELCVNYFAFYYLFPIKNATSYGYVMKKTSKTVIPLDKYSSRYIAQVALPFELLRVSLDSKKELNISYDEVTDKYGYVDLNNKIIIDYKFDKVEKFNNDYAIVALKIKDNLKYGTIDKNGHWIVKPKYDHLCPF